MGPGSADKPGNAAHALARREYRCISRSLAVRSDLHGGIHRARKAIRRLRALLALIGDRIDGVEAIDRKLSRLGDGFSRVRDAQVVLAIAQGVAARGDAVAWQPLLEHLAARRDDVTERLLAADPGFVRRRAAVMRIAAQLDALEWQRLRHKDLAAGWKHSNTRTMHAAKRAAKEPASDNLHRYRRRLRRLRLQWGALQALAPDIAATKTQKRIRAQHKTSNRLGRLRDLEALRNALRRARGIPDRSQLLSLVAKELRRAGPKPGWFD